MDEEMIRRLINEAIADINYALTGIDTVKDGLGLYGESAIEHNLESAKEKLRRITLESTGEM